MPPSGDQIAPPPVSFSSTNAAKPHNQYMFANVLADSIATPKDATDPRNSEESIPLSLTAQDLTLEESKTYMRWYSDILARTYLRTISMADVYQFLANFRLAADAQEKINRIFLKIMNLINIGEFFALLRVVSHTLDGKEPSRALIRMQTVVPVPPLILLKKRQNDEDEDPNPVPAPEPAAPLDLDLFTQFMLTGERPEDRKKRLKKLKSVKFSDQIVTDIHDVTPDLTSELDYLLPMDQLLSRIAGRTLTVPVVPQPVASPDPEEKEILKDMESQINHFRNLNSVDTMLVDGVPANIHLQHTLSPNRGLPQLLKPNMTGPAQMAQMGYQASQLEEANAYLNENNNGPYDSSGYTQSAQTPGLLQPNRTGPADMARMHPESTPTISLQSFTDQMTDTYNNTASNAKIGYGKDLPPPPIPAMRRARSMSQPNPLYENYTNGNGNEYPNGYPASNSNSLEVLQDRLRLTSLSPAPPIPPRSPLGRHPPPPPPSRRRGSSLASPPPVHSIDAVMGPTPPLPPKVLFYQNNEESSSTANILDDLKALQEEVDKIRDMTGGF